MKGATPYSAHLGAMEEVVTAGEPSQGGGLLIYCASWLATVFTVGLFSSGISACWKIHKSKSVGPLPHLPFVAASVNCSLWMTYGILKTDSTITYVNAIGVFLQLSYILVYHTYADMKYKIQRDFLVALVMVLSISLYYSWFVSDHMIVMRQLGLVCNFFTILFFASPLVTMAEVVRSKSTDTMSFPLSVMSVCATLSWVAYGMLIGDVYVMFPNIIGLGLACVQVSLFVMYRQKRNGIISMEAPIV